LTLVRDQSEVLAALSNGALLGSAVAPERIDTHAAIIFLLGDRAWKLKRAVRYDYLDFSTADRRRVALEAELRLNRRTAPNLYRAVHAINRAANGDLALDGVGTSVDWLLEMVRFPTDASFDRMAQAGRLSAALLTRLTDRLQAFHAAAAIAPRVDSAALLRRVAEGNRTSMAIWPAILDPHVVAVLAQTSLTLIDRHAGLLASRTAEGRVRHGHGDLHLSNIALIDGEPTLFDCLEFDPELATIDVLYDFAFLLMDLWSRGLRTEANLVFNRYLDLSPQDEAGIASMPLFLSLRAAIRAHVFAAASDTARDPVAAADRARMYLRLATDLMADVPARTMAIGGLSGTGKSTLARALGAWLGRPPGARIVRSDVVRKHLAGVVPEARLPAQAYTVASSAAVYDAIGQATIACLASGCASIADAVFAQPAEREAIEAVAARAGVRFDGVWLEAPTSARVARIEGRSGDASDADAGIARAQASLHIGDLGNWQSIDVSGGANAAVASVIAALGLQSNPSLTGCQSKLSAN